MLIGVQKVNYLINIQNRLWKNNVKMRKYYTCVTFCVKKANK